MTKDTSKLQVKMRPVGRPPKAKYDDATLVKLYNDGLSTWQIAHKVGISQATVWLHLRKIEQENA